MPPRPPAFFSLPRERIILIFALALAARLIFAVQWHALPYGPDPLLDAKIYHQWAQRIAAGYLFHPRAYYMMSLYPYALGLLYAILGHSLWVASLFNVLLDSATCVLLAELAYLAFGEEAALAAGILAALYRGLIFYTPMVMKESLSVFLLALFTLLAFRALRDKNGRLFLGSGIALGLDALVRGNVLALAPVILMLTWLREKPVAAKKNSLLFLAGLILSVLPVTLHNAVASHDFVLIGYEDGFNAYIGNGPMATGRAYEFPPEISSNPETEEMSVVRFAEAAEGRRLKPAEVSAYWWGRTFDYVFTHPRHEALVLFDKLEAFWSNAAPYDDYDMAFIARHFGTLLAAPLVDFGVVASLALFAAIMLMRKKRGEVVFFAALTFVYMLTLMVFYVTDRYRLLAVVFLLPLAGAAVPAAREAMRSKNRKRPIIAAFAAFVLLAMACIPAGAAPKIEAFDWGTLCMAYEDSNQHLAAILALNQALAMDGAVVGPEAWVRSADALDNLGHHPEAVASLKKVETLFPQDGTVAYDVGREALIDEDYPAAFVQFTRAIKLAPGFGLAYSALAGVYEHYGDRANALATVNRGLAEDPDDPVLVEIADKYR